MPELNQKEFVLHDWVGTLTFQQQALLLTGMRGPAGCTKHNPAKAIVRYLRAAVIKPAGDWKGGNDNDFMWGEWVYFGHHVKEFLNDVDQYPHHFLMHLIHCAEVIGYKHSNSDISILWYQFYLKTCKALHMNPETLDEMDKRLNDFGYIMPVQMIFAHSKHNSRCLQNAADDEPIFVLRAKDPTAPDIVREWADRNRGIQPDNKLAGAYLIANEMHKWRSDNIKE